METAPVFLTEKEERALRRMEQLTELRRARRKWWRYDKVGEKFLSEFFSPRHAFYFVGLFWVSKTVSRAHFPTGLFIFAAAYAALSLLFFFIIAPMKRRIEALENVLEEEIKRGS